VFPELFLSGYEPDRAQQLALAPGDEPLRVIAEAARQHGIAVLVGFVERVAPDVVANAVACFDADGEWRGSYRKTHLFGEHERAAFAPGDALFLPKLAGLRVGPLVCFDVEFPEPARALASAGAELLVTVAANMEPYGPDHALAARARALDNRLPHIYVNRVGEQSGLRFVGGSAAIAAGGAPLAQLGDGEAVATVELPVGAAAPADVDYLAHVRVGLPVHAVSSSSVRGGSR
ncbi:MAG TPA: nitrilase-related carbon-nitrogen hydrolase, partial [Conexibacter sp.]